MTPVINETQCRAVVCTRSDGFCERCGRCGGLTLHHRKKRGQGGQWSPDNCVMLCGHGTAGCHGWVEHNPNAAEAEGFHVRPWQDPATLPVLYRNQWGLLTPDGRIDLEQEELAPGDGELLLQSGN